YRFIELEKKVQRRLQRLRWIEMLWRLLPIAAEHGAVIGRANRTPGCRRNAARHGTSRAVAHSDDHDGVSRHGAIRMGTSLLAWVAAAVERRAELGQVKAPWAPCRALAIPAPGSTAARV